MRWLGKKLTRKLEIGKRKIKDITVGLIAVGFWHKIRKVGKIMLKKIILISALICMIVLLIFVQTGKYTTRSNIVKCADYDHPDDAITAIEASNKTLLVTESETCDNDFTVTVNVNVKFKRGGKWTINDGITVTFNGQIEAGLWQVFEYLGT